MMHKYPTSFQTTDAFIIDAANNRILLGQKPNKTTWCLPGGFVDPLKDRSLEQANARERREECGINLECDTPKYLFSLQVDDERYRNSEDKIMTAVFLNTYIFGNPVAGDDLNKLQWWPIDTIVNNYKTLVSKTHGPIIEKLITLGYLA